MQKELLSQIQIQPTFSIKEALKRIDATGLRILFVCDKDGCLIGSLSDGDIRRRVLKKGSMREKVISCFNRDPVCVAKGPQIREAARKIMLEKTIDVIPVVDTGKRIADVILWQDVFQEECRHTNELNVPVVIMAGGKGERLDPFTRILPKPLIPVGERPIIEIIIDKFRQKGVNVFYITLNYKGKMVKTYFDSIGKPYIVRYLWEKEFLGTAGSLKLLPSSIGDPFIVSNCDIIVSADYMDLVRFHQKQNNMLTVVGSLQHYKIPYGLVYFERNGRMRRIREKPEFDFTVNTGMYVVSSKALAYIPKNRKFDMTDFIQDLLRHKQNVGVYPVSQKSYIDVGQWEEYRNNTGDCLKNSGNDNFVYRTG